MTGKTHILVLDDDTEELELIKYHFDKSHVTNYQLFTDVYEFFENFTDDVYLAVVDYTLDGTTAVQIADRIQEINKTRNTIAACEVIVISGTTDIKIPVYFMNTKKANYFLLKSQNESFYYDLVVYASKAIERQQGWAELEKRKNGIKEFYGSLNIPDERK